MIPAKIISIDNKVMVEYYKLPEPSAKVYTMPVYYEKALKAYLSSKTITEAENVEIVDTVLGDVCYVLLNGKCRNLELNQTVFIEPTENNKVKIVKI
jgi:hypothetical protein